MPQRVDLIRDGKLLHLPDALWPHALTLGAEYGWQPRASASASNELWVRTLRAPFEKGMTVDEARALAAALERALPFIPDSDCRALASVDRKFPQLKAAKGIDEQISPRKSGGGPTGEPSPQGKEHLTVEERLQSLEERVRSLKKKHLILEESIRLLKEAINEIGVQPSPRKPGGGSTGNPSPRDREHLTDQERVRLLEEETLILEESFRSLEDAHNALGVAVMQFNARRAAREWSGPRKELLRLLITWCRTGEFSVLDYDPVAGSAKEELAAAA